MLVFPALPDTAAPSVPGTVSVYESAWETAMSALIALAVMVGAVSVGWVQVLVLGAGMAVLGGAFGACLYGGGLLPRRRAVDCALWSGAVGAMLFGVSEFARPWMLLTALVLAALCPPLVSIAIRPLRQRLPVRITARPHRLSDHDLQRRWRRTGADLRERADSVRAVLALVRERSRLLDEFERRDPERFEAMLVRAGWREAPRH